MIIIQILLIHYGNSDPNSHIVADHVHSNNTFDFENEVRTMDNATKRKFQAKEFTYVNDLSCREKNVEKYYQIGKVKTNSINFQTKITVVLCELK